MTRREFDNLSIDDTVYWLGDIEKTVIGKDIFRGLPYIDCSDGDTHFFEQLEINPV